MLATTPAASSVVRTPVARAARRSRRQRRPVGSRKIERLVVVRSYPFASPAAATVAGSASRTRAASASATIRFCSAACAAG